MATANLNTNGFCKIADSFQEDTFASLNQKGQESIKNILN